MSKEFSSLSPEQPISEQLTAIVDLYLPPETDHAPVMVFDGAVYAVKRECKLVEGDPLRQWYPYLKVTLGLQPGTPAQYSVHSLREGGVTYNWTPGSTVTSPADSEGPVRGDR